MTNCPTCFKDGIINGIHYDDNQGTFYDLNKNRVYPFFCKKNHFWWLIMGSPEQRGEYNSIISGPYQEKEQPLKILSSVTIKGEK